MQHTTKLTQILSILLIAACGEVAQTDEPTPEPTPEPTAGPTRPATGDLDHGIDPTTPPLPESPLIIDAPRAATTPGSLFQLTVRDHARVVSLIGSSAEPHVDILEQRIVTKGAEPIELVVDVAPPAGAFSRVIASDAIRMQYATVERVLCENGNIATFDPKCETATPRPAATPTSGAITAARWRLWVMDEQTGAAVAGCDAMGTRLACTLPGRAVATYRVVASVNGLSELWGGSSAPSVRTLDGREFSGATDRQYQCWDWEVSGSALYCRTRWDFTRYTAIDRAGIELEPLRVTLTADGIEASHESPALTWDSGDDDLPGAAY